MLQADNVNQAVADSTGLYWMSIDRGQIFRRSLDTEDSEALSEPSLSAAGHPRSMVVDHQRIYWSGIESSGLDRRGIWSVPISGGRVGFVTAARLPIRDLIADGDFLYWTDQERILRFDRGEPAAIRTVRPEEISRIVKYRDRIYFTAARHGKQAMLLQSITLTGEDLRTHYEVPFQSQRGISGMALDDSYVYLLEGHGQYDTRVRRIPR